MVVAVLFLAFQISSEDAFSGLVKNISRVASEHSSAINTSKSEKGKEEITRKNNERLVELVSKSSDRSMSFEYVIQGVNRNEDGEFSVVLEPEKVGSKTEIANRRSLIVPIKKELAESLFPGDLLAFSGFIKLGGDPRSKHALPFAVVRPDDLKLLAIWLDEIEIGDSKPKPKARKDKEPSSDALTPETIVTQVDRLFKTARQEVLQGKSTADKQDAANHNFKTIVESLEQFHKKTFVCETQIRDVFKEKTTGNVVAILDQPLALVPFREGYADTPLNVRDSIRISIAEEDRAEFQIGRKLTVSGTLAITVVGESSSSDFIWVRANSQWIAKSAVQCDKATINFSLQNIQTNFFSDDSGQKSSKTRDQPNLKRPKR